MQFSMLLPVISSRPPPGPASVNVKVFWFCHTFASICETIELVMSTPLYVMDVTSLSCKAVWAEVVGQHSGGIANAQGMMMFGIDYQGDERIIHFQAFRMAHTSLATSETSVAQMSTLVRLPSLR